MNLGVVIDGNSRFIHELLEDWRTCFETRSFEFHDLKFPLFEERLNRARCDAALRQFLRSNDVVFFEWAAAHLALASQMHSRTPIIARLHSWEFFEHADRIQWDAVSRIVLVSHAMHKRFLMRFPDQSGKASVVYPGKSLSQFSVRPHKFAGRIGMACDITPIKRVYDVVLSLYNLNLQGFDLTFDLAGEPPDSTEDRRYFASIESAIARLGLRDRVVFHGWVSNPASWFQNVDIFISNSYWEGLQNALVEAMACGCYCLSHCWEGVEEFLPEKYIYVTPFEMEQRIAAYCRCSEEERLVHQSELRRIVEEKFNLADMLDRMRGIVTNAGAHFASARQKCVATSMP